ncbi:MAG: type II restriction endonuclease [Alphaproteobacteria bacterium]
MNDVTFLTEIPQNEQKPFDDYIQNARKTFILSPKETVKTVLRDHVELMEGLRTDKNVSDTILRLRNESFHAFLIQESKMNAYLLNHISEKFPVPAEKFMAVYGLFEKSKKDMEEKLRDFFGDFSGQIYPYIYRLSLSNTQSRRSRAGKIFEGIVYGLYDVLGYSYESQTSVGSKHFQSKKLGKIVDSLLPSLSAFEQRRDKVIIGTMKTTLRERWQEVIEEISRTSLPKIYLLTVDEDISLNKVEQMANHNVILVVYKNVKEQSSALNKRNVISFEDFFFDEIPQTLAYWKSS